MCYITRVYISKLSIQYISSAPRLREIKINIPCILWNTKINFYVHKYQPINYILRQINQINTFRSYFF
jgi:hypothetical protein